MSLRRRAPLAMAATAVVVCASAYASACASPAEPPGGPADDKPPHLIGTTPDSGKVRAKVDEVSFAFDEVLQETPRGASTLAGIVLVSPTDGDPVVNWKRTRITVHPKHGWRANTTYVVTLLSGVSDLKGNVRDTANVVVFSTGDSIPRTRIAGVAFDWSKGGIAARAYVDARAVNDTTLAYAAEADSTGRFSLPYLPSGDYIVRALLDANHNRAVDPREQWDSVRVQLRDSAAVELYAFPHDSEPRLRTVTVQDSLTLRIAFDKPLLPDSGYLPKLELRAPDSTMLAIARISTWAEYTARKDARARVVRDSTAAADTSTARRTAREQIRRDSIERAATIADSIARDPRKRVPPPESKRPALITEIAVELREILPAGTRYVATAHATGILAGEKQSTTSFSRPKPAPPPPAARPARTDTLTAPATRPPMQRD